MSVRLTLNLDSGEWDALVEPESSSPTVEVGFTNDGDEVAFDDLAFGVLVVANGSTVLDATYPPEGVTFVSTDQTYLSADTLTLASDDEATVTVSAENAGERFDTQVTFTVPRPPQPYPSWSWSDGGWKPPVPPPDFDRPYQWDEDAQVWVPATED